MSYPSSVFLRALRDFRARALMFRDSSPIGELSPEAERIFDAAMAEADRVKEFGWLSETDSDQAQDLVDSLDQDVREGLCLLGQEVFGWNMADLESAVAMAENELPLLTCAPEQTPDQRRTLELQQEFMAGILAREDLHRIGLGLCLLCGEQDQKKVFGPALESLDARLQTLWPQLDESLDAYRDYYWRTVLDPYIFALKHHWWLTRPMSGLGVEMDLFDLSEPLVDLVLEQRKNQAGENNDASSVLVLNKDEANDLLSTPCGCFLAEHFGSLLDLSAAELAPEEHDVALPDWVVPEPRVTKPDNVN